MLGIGWRRTALVLTLYGAAVVAWLAFSTGAGASLVLSGHDAGGATAWGRLVGVFTSGSSREAVLDRWGMSRPAVAAALGIHAVLLLLVIRWSLREEQPRATGTGGWCDRLTTLIVLVASLGFLSATAFFGSVQDYTLFQDIWREVLRGHDPWYLVPGGPRDHYPLNAYGPLFNLLAPPTLWHPLGPKLIFAAAYWFFVAHLVLVVGRRTLPPWGRLAAVVWFCSPYPVIEIALMGHFDVLVALLAIAAIEARARDRWNASAGWLASGVLLKYYPGVLAPFLALDRGRVRVRYLATSAGLVAAGLGIAWLIWGNAVGRPLWLAVERDSGYLSIFRVLRGSHSPIGRDTLFFSPDQYATPLMLFALYKGWRWSRRNLVAPRAACALAATITLALYKVGFPQYYMLLYLTAANWLVREFATMRRPLLVTTAYAAVIGWLTWFDWLIVLGKPSPTDEWAGVPMFALMVLLIAAIIAWAPRETAEPPATIETRG